MRELTVDAGASLEQKARVYKGRVELVPETARRVARYSLLRANLADRLCRVFLLGACLAQVADAVTTAFALRLSGRYEANSIMHDAVTQPITTGALKVLLIVMVSGLAILRLPTRQARLALFLAMTLSALAPIHNIVQLFGP